MSDVRVSVVTYEEFKSLDATALNKPDPYSKAYGTFRVGKTTYKLAWASDLMVPTVVLFKKKLIAGFDNTLIIFDVSSKKYFFEKQLLSNFLFIVELESVFIIFEYSGFVFRDDGEIREFSFPLMALGYKAGENSIDVILEENEMMKLN